MMNAVIPSPGHARQGIPRLLHKWLSDDQNADSDRQANKK
jgi:hypothetical protein